jgi:hypothetical protein
MTYTYNYSLIRFVPDPGRGEFVNIGAVAGDDAGEDWSLRAISNYQRAKALDTKSAFPAAMAFIASIAERMPDVERLEVTPTLSSDDLRRLSEEMQNIVQLTSPAPIVADSAEAALDLVFERLVVDPAQRRYRFKKKTTAQAATRRSYEQREIPSEALMEHATATAGANGTPFDFVVHNGGALQLVHCWSFQLPNQDDLIEQVRSWAWGVHEVRERGADVPTPSGAIEIPRTCDIAAVGLFPVEDQEAPALLEAEEAFKEVGVRLVPAEEVDTVTALAADLLSAVH